MRACRLLFRQQVAPCVHLQAVPPRPSTNPHRNSPTTHACSSQLPLLPLPLPPPSRWPPLPRWRRRPWRRLHLHRPRQWSLWWRRSPLRSLSPLPPLLRRRLRWPPCWPRSCWRCWRELMLNEPSAIFWSHNLHVHTAPPGTSLHLNPTHVNHLCKWKPEDGLVHGTGAGKTANIGMVMHVPCWRQLAWNRTRRKERETAANRLQGRVSVRKSGKQSGSRLRWVGLRYSASLPPSGWGALYRTSGMRGRRGRALSPALPGLLVVAVAFSRATSLCRHEGVARRKISGASGCCCAGQAAGGGVRYNTPPSIH